jgi:[ribosomal protein S18]-alanine N-acetyltransferase
MTAIRQLNAPCTQLEQIHSRCFDYGWSAGVFADLLIKPHHRTYVFEADGDVVSFVVMAVVAGEGEILTIATDPAYQNKGLARMLLTQVITALREEGASSLFLECATDNEAALRLYESCGFKRCGRRKAYYSRKDRAPVDAHILRLALN